MNKLFILFLIFYFGFFNFLLSQDHDYFQEDCEYHYNAIYIDSHGDTITEEILILKPLGRPWFFQPWLQVAIKYIYNTDTLGFKNYVDPDPWWHEKNQKYFSKKGKLKISSSENTGAFAKRGIFYMHPPRDNQYRMLFYSPHPFVYFKSLNDTTNKFKRNGGAPGMGGETIQEYTVTPLKDVAFNKSKIRAWKVYATSSGDYNDYKESLKIYDSTLDAIFTKEYGFIKMHYNFENNIKIQFDLKEVVYK